MGTRSCTFLISLIRFSVSHHFSIKECTTCTKAEGEKKKEEKKTKGEGKRYPVEFLPGFSTAAW